jgi:hypothetical protein
MNSFRGGRAPGQAKLGYLQGFSARGGFRACLAPRSEKAPSTCGPRDSPAGLAARRDYGSWVGIWGLGVLGLGFPVLGLAGGRG